MSYAQAFQPLLSLLGQRVEAQQQASLLKASQAAADRDKADERSWQVGLLKRKEAAEAPERALKLYAGGMRPFQQGDMRAEDAATTGAMRVGGGVGGLTSLLTQSVAPVVQQQATQTAANDAKVTGGWIKSALSEAESRAQEAERERRANIEFQAKEARDRAELDRKSREGIAANAIEGRKEVAGMTHALGSGLSAAQESMNKRSYVANTNREASTYRRDTDPLRKESVALRSMADELNHPGPLTDVALKDAFIKAVAPGQAINKFQFDAVMSAMPWPARIKNYLSQAGDRPRQLTTELRKEMADFLVARIESGRQLQAPYQAAAGESLRSTAGLLGVQPNIASDSARVAPDVFQGIQTPRIGAGGKPAGPPPLSAFDRRRP